MYLLKRRSTLGLLILYRFIANWKVIYKWGSAYGRSCWSTQQFGNYRLIRLLGQGGFADVYLAEHIHLETQAAVKVLSMQLTSESVEHFRTEARTIARLIHPNIVRVLDFGVEKNTPYLAMDDGPISVFLTKRYGIFVKALYKLFRRQWKKRLSSAHFAFALPTRCATRS
jgi:serine/threonine protein kinase